MGRFFHPFSDICLLNPVEIWGNVPENLKEVLVELRVPWHFKILWNGKSRVYGLFSNGWWGCLIFNCLVRKLYNNLWSLCILRCAAFRITQRRALPFSYTYNAHNIHSCHSKAFPRGMRSLCYGESSRAFGVQSALIWPAFHQFDWDCATAIFPCCCTALYTYCDCHICFPYCMYCICMLEMPCDVSHY